MSSEKSTLITDEIVDKARRALMRAGKPGHFTVGCTREVLRAALEAVEGDIIEEFGASGSAPEAEADDGPEEFGDTVGYCSQCGEAREAFYTCRQGGETIPKGAGK